MSTAERDKHVDWMIKLLAQRHQARQNVGSEPDLEPIDLEDVKKEARLAKRFRAAADIETVAEAAARAGKIWLKPPEPFGRSKRTAWIVPTEPQWRDIRQWLLGHAAIVLLICERKAGRTRRELLLAADTSYLSARVSERFGFPAAMFQDIIWPRIAADLTAAKWEVRSREVAKGSAIVLCTPGAIAEAFKRIVEGLPAEDTGTYFRNITRYHGDEYVGYPSALKDIITPYASSCRNLNLAKMEGKYYNSSAIFEESGLITVDERYSYFSDSSVYGDTDLDLRRGLAALLLSGFGEAIGY
jgi:hypothetical protein